jgi:hypothetical protein
MARSSSTSTAGNNQVRVFGKARRIQHEGNLEEITNPPRLPDVLHAHRLPAGGVICDRNHDAPNSAPFFAAQECLKFRYVKISAEWVAFAAAMVNGLVLSFDEVDRLSAGNFHIGACGVEMSVAN